MDALKRDPTVITAAQAIQTINQVNQVFLQACFSSRLGVVPTVTSSASQAITVAALTDTHQPVDASMVSSSDCTSPAASTSSVNSSQSPSAALSAASMVTGGVYAGLDRRVVLEEDAIVNTGSRTITVTVHA